MASEVGSIYISVTADSSKAVSELGRVKTSLADVGKQSDLAARQLAASMARSGTDFRQLGGSVDDWIGKLKAATPQNARFAQELDEITRAFQEGRMGPLAAVDDLEKLREEMQKVEQEQSRLQNSHENYSKAVQSQARDLSGLSGEMDGWIKNLKAATPANIEYARQLEEITRAYKDGKMGAGDAQKAIEQLKKEMEASSQNSESFVKKLTGGLKNAGMVIGGIVAAVTAVGVAFKQAMDFGREGAAVEQTTRSFQNLLVVVGAAPDLLDKLRSASGNTIDDLKLMSSVTTLLAGAQGDLATELAGSTPELLEIAKAANKLNPSLGDTTFMFESLALGIKRGSPMILDNLGLTIKIGEANDKYAASLGKTADKLTTEEQKIALLNATLEAGQTLIQQAGGNTDSATDAFDELSAAIKNTADTTKQEWAPILQGLARDTTAVITTNEKLTTKLKEGAAASSQSASSYDEYVASLKKSAEGTSTYIKEKDGEIQVYQRINGVMQEVTDKIGTLTEAQWEAQHAGRAYDVTQKAIAARMPEIGDAAQAAAVSTEEAAKVAEEANKRWRQSVEDNTAAAAAQAEKMYSVYDGLKEANADLAEANKEFGESYSEKVAGALEKAGIEGDKYTEALAVLDKQNGTTLLSQYKANEALEEAIAAYAESGKIDVFSAALDTNKDAWEKLDGNVQAAKTALEQARAAFNNLVRDIASATGKRWSLEVSINGVGGGGGNMYSKTPTTQTTKDGVTTVTTAGGGKIEYAEKAAGGPVLQGGSYLVGERGPELFVPNNSGQIVPADRTAALQAGQGAGGPKVVIENLIINAGAGANGYSLANQLQSALGNALMSAAQYNAGAGYAGG